MPRLSRSVLNPFSRRGCSQIIRCFSSARSIALFISISGSIVNLLLALKFNSLWSSLKSAEPESEWEGSLDSWSGESLTLLWGLLSCYFAAEAVSSLVGFIGIVKVRDTPHTQTIKPWLTDQLGRRISPPLSDSVVTIPLPTSSSSSSLLSLEPTLSQQTPQSGLVSVRTFQANQILSVIWPTWASTWRIVRYGSRGR